MRLWLPWNRTIKDDRGNRCDWPSPALAHWVTQRSDQRKRLLAKPDSWRHLTWQVDVVAALVLFGLYFAGVFSAVVVPIIIVLAGITRAIVRASSVGSPAPTLVALGRCGSCGYGLSELKPAPDDCVVCPECGAAWHRWRNCQIDQATWPPRLADRPDLTPPGTDDRGVWTIIIDPPSVGLTRTDERDMRLATLALDRAAHALRRRIAVIAVITFGMGLLLFWMGRVPGFVVAPPGCGGIVLGVLLFIGAATVSPGTMARRGALLSIGLCPSCLAIVEGLAPEVDGCAQCKRCRAAWRQADIGPHPMLSPIANHPERCRRCGYNLAGIAAPDCPECGWNRRGRLQSPPPTGRPVCNRCGHDMRGREHNRICPDCGAMYGIDYRE